MKIVLFQPQIPQNAGNIVRTCAVNGCSLIMIRPLGFSTSSKMLRRAGLDYWEGVDVKFYDSFDDCVEKELEENPKASLYFFSSKAEKKYTDISYQWGDLLVFGSETTGLPEQFHHRWGENFCTLPMRKGARCLNLSNAVAIASYEAWRQLDFSELRLETRSLV